MLGKILDSPRSAETRPFFFSQLPELDVVDASFSTYIGATNLFLQAQCITMSLSIQNRVPLHSNY
jgi:hypothetical protein